MPMFNANLTTHGRLHTVTRWLAFPLILVISSCASTDIAGPQYVDQQPAFDLVAFFDGPVRAWGIVQDRSDKVVQRFTVDIDGQWQDGTLTLDETFRYGVGSGPEERVWTITPAESGGWSGEASDILGEASGRSFGNAFNWTYQMDLPVGDSSYVVNFDDWFWSFDENTLMNRSYITKFGITFAEVTIFMQKQTGQ